MTTSHLCPVAVAGDAVDPAWCFDSFADVLAGLQPITADAHRPELMLASDGPWTIGYCPFDWVNPTAKVVLVGITPGLQQMNIANRAAQQALHTGATHDDALRQACTAASFAGPMRRNLVAMLDGIGLHRHLGIDTTATLFAQHAVLLHSTSALLYPVFHHGENYTGGPDPTRSPLLRSFIDHVLPAELNLVPDALVIPLGQRATELVRRAERRGAIDTTRCLRDFPHPSGGNGYRTRLYQQHRDALTEQAAAWFTRVPTGEARTPPARPVATPHVPRSQARPSTPATKPEAHTTEPQRIYSINRAGQKVRPHLYRDGRYRVSRTKHATDQIPVAPDEPLGPWLAKGYHLRMSVDGTSPSLFAPDNIHGWRR